MLHKTSYYKKKNDNKMKYNVIKEYCYWINKNKNHMSNKSMILNVQKFSQIWCNAY